MHALLVISGRFGLHVRMCAVIFVFHYSKSRCGYEEFWAFIHFLLEDVPLWRCNNGVNTNGLVWLANERKLIAVKVYEASEKNEEHK